MSTQRSARSILAAAAAFITPLLLTSASPVAGAEQCVSRLPATGQTTSYAPGDDGAYRKGAPLSYTDNGNGTITDNNTHLVWEKKNKSGGIHDADTVFVWPDPITVFVHTLNNRCTNDETIDCTAGGDAACNVVGGKCGFAGYRDWRLPNARESASIINYGAAGPAMSKEFNKNCVPGCTNCSCVADTDFVPYSSMGPSAPQTATSTYGSGGDQWYSLYNDGFTGHLPIPMYARAVRGGCDAGALTATGQPASESRIAGDDGDLRKGAPLSFTDNGDGTITDENTHLVWEKKTATPGLHNQDATYSWTDALGIFIPTLNNRCANNDAIDCTVGGDAACSLVGGQCGFAGHRDWRVPNIRELQTIPVFSDVVDVVPNAPNNNYGPGLGTAFNFWTSTSHAANPLYPWHMCCLRHASAGAQLPTPRTDAYRVRAVRGGK